MEDKVPYRGEKYKRIASEIGALVDAKNEAYDDSFRECRDFLILLYPHGVPVDQYENMLAIVRTWDKIKRIATHKDAFGENPWRDIAGYAILMCALGDNTGDGDDIQRKNEWERTCLERGFTAADYDVHGKAPK
jgi:hypothetical protein